MFEEKALRADERNYWVKCLTLEEQCDFDNLIGEMGYGEAFQARLLGQHIWGPLEYEFGGMGIGQQQLERAGHDS